MRSKTRPFRGCAGALLFRRRDRCFSRRFFDHLYSKLVQENKDIVYLVRIQNLVGKDVVNLVVRYFPVGFPEQDKLFHLGYVPKTNSPLLIVVPSSIHY